MKRLTTLYEQMPTAGQNVMVSVYGLVLHWQRYGPGSSRYAEELRRHESWSPERLRELEIDLLRSRALFAIERVPAYRHLLRHVPSIREARTGEEILDHFPVLTKSEIRSNAEAFIPTGLREKILFGATSGTTGTPLKLFRTREGIRRNFAFFGRVRRWRELTHWNRTATMLGRAVVPKEQCRPPYWRHSWFTHNLLLSPYHVGPGSVESYAEALAVFRPEQVVCIPSCALPIAEKMLSKGMALDSVRTVFTTAETLSPAQRSVFEQAFGAQVADQYGASEWTVWISQCEHGTYHIHPEYGFLELLDEEGKRIENGRGRAITTGFINDAMVMMRYDTGDYMEGGFTAACPCGRPFRTISKIDGRVEDSIRTPKGRVVPGTLVSLFRGLSGIAEGQVIQTSASTLVVKIVPDEKWGVEAHKQLVAGLDQRLGGGMAIHVELVPTIPRTAGGKFRSVIGLASRSSVEIPESQGVS